MQIYAYFVSLEFLNLLLFLKIPITRRNVVFGIYYTGILDSLLQFISINLIILSTQEINSFRQNNFTQDLSMKPL